MQFPSPTRYGVGDVDLAVYEQGSGRPVILLHGFPELGYSWRHQLPALADAGYRAIAYDQRGYGASTAPEGVAAYGIEHLVGDLVGLVDVMQLENPVVIGHDWGSIVSMSALVMRPDVFTAGGSLNVPYRGWSVGFPSTAYIAEHLADRFGYVLWFHDGDKAEMAFAADPTTFLNNMYTRIARNPDFLTDDDLAYYVDTFTASGITPALNWYRNIDANLVTTEHLAGAVIDVPYLMAAADGDPVLPASLTEGMERWVPQMRRFLIEDAGHWVQQEQPEAVSKAIVSFLEELA